MAIDFQDTPPFIFSPTTGKVQSHENPVQFPTKVNKSAVMLTGFSIGYYEEDHHVLKNMIDASAVHTDKTVTVRVDFALRDGSGKSYDEDYSGDVTALVIVDRETDEA